MKGIKKLVTYSTISTLSLACITGCLNKSSNDEKNVRIEKTTEEENNVTAIKELEENVKKEDKKIFAPYKHLFYVRFDNLKSGNDGMHITTSEDITGGAVSIPDGYDVFEIENFSSRIGRGSQTQGYDVWYMNTTPVEVEAVYNQSLKKYDYSHFGTMIEEKENSSSKTLQKRSKSAKFQVESGIFDKKV